jgi:16S rRNA (uracil1498-N3)-methyltransferase
LESAQVGDEVHLEPSEAHHFSNVLRGKIGYHVHLMDGLGREAAATCSQKEKKKVAFVLDALVVFSKVPKDLVLKGPIPKGKRFPYMLEKCQELGLAAWTPLATEHSVREELSPSGREKIKDRLRDACKQSRNPWLLTLGEEEQFADGLDSELQTVVLDVDAPPIWSLPELCPKRPIQLLYGPEAGWSDGERERLKERDCSFLGLSAHHLRMETAAVIGSAMLLEWLEPRHQDS